MNYRGPMRGEMWIADLNPSKGHEQGGRRPCLVVSSNTFNEGAAEMVVVLPATTKNKRIHFHVVLSPPEGGVVSPTYVKPEDIRSISKQRLVKRMGAVAPETMNVVETRLLALLDMIRR